MKSKFLEKLNNFNKMSIRSPHKKYACGKNTHYSPKSSLQSHTQTSLSQVLRAMLIPGQFSMVQCLTGSEENRRQAKP